MKTLQKISEISYKGEGLKGNIYLKISEGTDIHSEFIKSEIANIIRKNHPNNEGKKVSYLLEETHTLH